MLAFGGELDHGSRVEFADFDALGPNGANAEAGSAGTEFAPLIAQAPQTIRGFEQPIAIWTPARAA
jgi:hypothetical protein